jgi:hypothetical protein
MVGLVVLTVVDEVVEVWSIGREPRLKCCSCLRFASSSAVFYARHILSPNV